MKNFSRRLTGIVLSAIMLCSGVMNCAAQSEESVSVEPEVLFSEGTTESVRLARVTEENVWLYYDREMTQPAFPAVRDDSYVIVENGEDTDVFFAGETQAVQESFCVEALDEQQNIIHVYVSASDVTVWEEEALGASLTEEQNVISEPSENSVFGSGEEKEILPESENTDAEEFTAEWETVPADEEVFAGEEKNTSEIYLSDGTENEELFSAGISEISETGSFYLTAQYKDQLLIPPVTVYFAPETTIISLMANINGHQLLTADGTVYSVDGCEAGYVGYSENGALSSLEGKAEEISYLTLSEQAADLSAERQELIRVMAQYQQDPVAQANETVSGIYGEILPLYTRLTNEEAAEWAKKLDTAMRRETIETGGEQEPQKTDGIYQIGTGGEMKWFADLVNGDLEGMEAEQTASAVLTADIDISAWLWKPVGNSELPFSGSFDGQGHTVFGLNIQSDQPYQALFGYVSAEGAICDVCVSGYVETGADYTAGIAAYSEAHLSGLVNRCRIVSSGNNAGGIAGGLGDEVMVENCLNEGAVYTSAQYAGGIAGSGGIYRSCRNTGMVTGSAYAGGITGFNRNIVENCINTGSICAGQNYAGGVSGLTSYGVKYVNAGILKCENFGTVSGRQYIGGISGECARVSSCTNRGNIIQRGAMHSKSYTGGITGASDNGITVNAASGLVQDCFNYGNVVSADGFGVGGISGCVNGKGTSINKVVHGKVIHCANFGDITGENEVGGIAGSGDVEQCFNTGTVKGSSAVGGIVGGGRATASVENATAVNNFSLIESCYNMGSVFGNICVGGIAGQVRRVSDCYNVGMVNGNDTYLGLVAGNYLQVENCFYVNTASFYTGEAKGVSPVELRTVMLGSEYFRLNFSMEYHSGYPYLSFEKEAEAVDVDCVELPEGTADRYYTGNGMEPEGLPEFVNVRAGGLSFSCGVTWIPGADYDYNKEGTYIFSPQIMLPEGCALREDTDIACITVTVVRAEQLPLVTELSLEDGTDTEYFTCYGKEPEGLPTRAVAVIDGTERGVSVSWTPPEEYDLTDTRTPILYTMRLEEALRLAEGVELPEITVRVLPEMLAEDIHFTQYNADDSERYPLYLRDWRMEDGEAHFYYDLELLDTSGFLDKSTISGNARKGVYLWGVPDSKTSGGSIISKKSYTTLEETPREIKDSVINTEYQRGFSCFAAEDPAYVGENDLLVTVTAGKGEDAVTQYYHVHSRIHPTLESLDVSANGESLFLTPSFSGSGTEYSVFVPSGTEHAELQMSRVLPGDQASVRVDGESAVTQEDGTVTASVSVEGTGKTVSVLLTRTLADGSEADTEYRIRLVYPEETRLKVTLTPEEAILRIFNGKTGVLTPKSDGTYSLIRGYSYEYMAAAQGYLTRSGTITAEDEEMELVLEMEKAPDNPSIVKDLESDWDSFRGNPDNNAVTDALTPTSGKDALLYWASQAGAGYGSEAISSPILVGGYLITTSKQNIFKLDTITGEIVAVGDMVTSSVFNITPPTYGDGMIFVALAGGIVQAFNADTLESLWVYTDPLGGQPNSPIAYKDGFVYTGFWNNEMSDGSFVCLSATDEKPGSTLESKKALWTYAQKGGFYWAGAYVSENFVLVGTDDGESGYVSETAKLLSLDPRTGMVIDSLDNIKADVRSTVCYDAETGRYYFTTKGGYFYSVAVSSDGRIDHDSVKILDLRGDRTGDNGIPVEGMCTSTPVVYNGRAYVGVSGVGQFMAYNGHCIAVIDLAGWEIAYTCPTKGYPQTSGLLTTGYGDTGKVYLYFFENASPGTLRIICDSPGQTEMVSVEDGASISTAEDLFTPRGSQRQFALCSPIADEYGTIYFKNDSGYMMALGSTIDKIEVTVPPAKTMYEEGEPFDPAGMQVTAFYTNGLTRDVTDYVSFSEEGLMTRDTDITIYFNHVMYNNTSEVIDPPHTSVNLTVLSSLDMETLNSVISQIAALGEITLASRDDIRTARRSYDNLKDSLKEFVTNYETLTAAEESYNLLEQAELARVNQVIRLIDAIGEVTLESGDTIQKATELYEALTNFGKVRVTNYAQLKAAQQKYQSLVGEQDARAAEVMKKISAIGEVSLESGTAIVEARTAYDLLDEGSRKKVTNYASLTAAEETYQMLVKETEDRARAVISLIEAIGTVTLDKEEAIRQAREAYEELEENAARQVTNYETLTKAEAKLSELKAQMEALNAVTRELDGYMEQIRAAAPVPEEITAENAAVTAPLIVQIETLVAAQAESDRALLDSYLDITDAYRSAIGNAVHMDPAAGVTAEGLEWNQKLVVQELTEGEEDYKYLENGISPQKVIQAFRVQVLDLLTGDVAADHEKLLLEYEILVPQYNESAYSAIGVAAMGSDGAVSAVSSTYTDHKRKLAFAVTGDGVIAVAGTKAEMNAGEDRPGGDSILDNTDNDPSGSDNTDTPGGTDSPGNSGASEKPGTSGITDNTGNSGTSSGSSGISGGSGSNVTVNNGSAGSSGSVLSGSGSSTTSGGSSGRTTSTGVRTVTGSGSTAGTGGGSAAVPESVNQKKAEVNGYYGVVIDTGEWEYQKTVIPQILLDEFEKDQVRCYQNLSEAVEAGEEEFISDPLDKEAFDMVLACYRQSNPLGCLVEDVTWNEKDGTAVITYALTAKQHRTMIDEWQARTELIIDYCLETGDEEKTAANLYEYLTTNMKPYTTETGSVSEAEKEELYRKFAPGPFYAMMAGEVSTNDAACVYEYLLMQVGIKGIPVQVNLTKEAEISEKDAETDTETNIETDTETNIETDSEEESKNKPKYHQWVVLSVEDSWYHADPELDIAAAAGKNTDADVLGHFGMDDDTCRRALNTQKKFEVQIPDEMEAYCIFEPDETPLSEKDETPLSEKDETKASEGRTDETKTESQTDAQDRVRPSVPVCSKIMKNDSVSQTVAVENKEDTANE